MKGFALSSVVAVFLVGLCASTLGGCSRPASKSSVSSALLPPVSITVRSGSHTLKIDGRNPGARLRMVVEEQGQVREVDLAPQYPTVILPSKTGLLDPRLDSRTFRMSSKGREYRGPTPFFLQETAESGLFRLSLILDPASPGTYGIKAAPTRNGVTRVFIDSLEVTSLRPGGQTFVEIGQGQVLRCTVEVPITGARNVPELGQAFLWRSDEAALPIRGLSQQVRTLLTLSETPSPFAGTDTRFQNHVFWDTDVWMFPAVAIFDEALATKLFDYRFDRISAARKNFATWRAAGYPTANKTNHQPLPELTKLMPGVVPAMFPWESKLDGSEGSPSDTVHQHHVTAAVGLMAMKAELHGIGSAGERRELLAGCAAFFLHRLAKNPDGTYGILNTLSPSEWHTASNDLYTNAAADVILRHVLGPDKWPLGKIKLPRRADAGTFATFDEDTYREYQQAAALLAIWPARHPSVTPESSKMLEFYRGKTSPFGPAMSHSLHSLIAARQGRVDLAWEEFEKSWRPYSSDVRTEFREKPNSAASYFVTGAAGVLNAFFYGFLGFEVSFEEPATRKLRAETRTGGWVSFDPKIPDDWPSIRLPYREFELQITELDPKTNQRTASLFSGTELMFTTSLPATGFSTKAQKVR